MIDSYDVDDSVGVSSRSSASFGDGVSMTDSKSISGSGDANINQVLYGSGRGADYVINYALETFGASSLEGSGGATLTPESGSVSRSASTIGSSETFSELYGTQEGDFAGVASGVLDGDLTTSQSFAAGQSVAATQNMRANGEVAVAYSEAEDAEGSLAWTSSLMTNGMMSTAQTAESGNSARSSQTSEINASLGRAGSGALDADGNFARTYVEMRDEEGDGVLVTEQTAEADGGAEADQISFMEADRGEAGSMARDDNGNVAVTEAVMVNGSLETEQGTWAGEDRWFDDEGAVAFQWTEIIAERGAARSEARDDNGNLAVTEAVMANGTLETVQGAWAGEDWRFEYEGAEAGQWTEITAENGSAESYAEDSNESYVEISAKFENGTLETEQWAEASNSASGYQNTSIEGEFAYAFCEANNTGKDYYAYVDNWIEGNASLEFEGEASVNASKARANQSSHAEGDFIWPWANSTSLDREVVTNGTYRSESKAWTNGTGEGAVIVEL